MLVVGPCSIHDEKSALEYARRLAELARRVTDRLFVLMRVYFEKPRTTVGWKGLINDPHLDDTFDISEGLRIARRILLRIAELGLPAATEMLEPITPQYIADLDYAGLDRRPHHRIAHASADGQRFVDAGRIQKRHRWQFAGGPRCDDRGPNAACVSWASTAKAALVSCNATAIRGAA